MIKPWALFVCLGVVSCAKSIEGDEAGECSDGVDNDQDGLVDCDDEGCVNATACVEADTDTDTDTDSDTDTDTDTDSDCSPLAAATGNVIDVEPSDAGNLATLIAGASEGDTFSLADGTYNVDGNILVSTDNITIRSASGDRDAVVLDAGYRGASVIQLSANDVTIADLTLANAWYHGVHVRPVGGATESIFRPLLYNIRVHNPGQQGIKINQEGTAYVDEGVVACSSIELDATGRQEIRDNCYTGGIDAHRGKGWVYRDNWIEGFWCESGLSEHGIHLWRQNEDSVIERNQIVNCARGIGLGMANSSAGNDRFGDDLDCPEGEYIDDYKGMVRNNFVFADDPALFASNSGFDNGISVWSACQAEVYHNTIWSTQEPFASIEYRFKGTTVTVVNNIVSDNIKDRGVSSFVREGNIERADAALLVDGDGGDLHLNPSATGAVNMGVTSVASKVLLDVDGDTRDAQPDVGADEVP